MEKVCGKCKQVYEAARRDQKFCSNSCRVLAARKRLGYVHQSRYIPDSSKTILKGLGTFGREVSAVVAGNAITSALKGSKGKIQLRLKGEISNSGQILNVYEDEQGLQYIRFKSINYQWLK